jgi:2-methylcitrate dehydratase PrpD
MSNTVDSRESELAAFAATLEAEDLPETVRDRAGLVIADTVGAILGGSSDPAVASLVDVWETNGKGATLFGTPGSKSTPHRAAFFNGTAGTGLEVDEGHRYAGGHPAIHVFPALFADAELEYGSREAFLTAFVAGYEVAVRTAQAANPLADGYHPHGVWGAVGGAAAVANHRGFDAEETRHAMAIAANYAQHTRFEAAFEGATVRNSYAGMSNLAALIAVDQVEAGFSGLENGIARHLDSATADGVDTEALVAGLGETWEIERGYFKRYAACRYTHAALDATLALRDEENIESGDVERVTVETYATAATLDEPHPTNALQAKFSVPFAVATALISGHAGKSAFSDDAIDEQRRTLAERVSVTAAEPFTERAPDARGARVEVRLADGTTHSRAVRAARGGEHDPLSETELEEKFLGLATPVVGADRANRLWEAARKPEAPRVISAFTDA